MIRKITCTIAFFLFAWGSNKSSRGLPVNGI